MNHQSASGEQSEAITVHVLFFGAARDASGKPEVQLSLPRSATASDALLQILQIFPDLRRFGNSLLLAVNQEYAADRDLEVHDGDELALFPPVSGGQQTTYRTGDAGKGRKGESENSISPTRHFSPSPRLNLPASGTSNC